MSSGSDSRDGGGGNGWELTQSTRASNRPQTAGWRSFSKGSFGKYVMVVASGWQCKWWLGRNSSSDRDNAHEFNTTSLRRYFAIVNRCHLSGCLLGGVDQPSWWQLGGPKRNDADHSVRCWCVTCKRKAKSTKNHLAGVSQSRLWAATRNMEEDIWRRRWSAAVFVSVFLGRGGAGAIGETVCPAATEAAADEP